MKPVISIVVPVYKVEDYLIQCLDSILNQSFSDFELILVDDGSPDKCPDICDEYAKKDARVKVIHCENAGVSVARNKGVDLSKGEYIAFVDADDILAFNFCELLYRVIDDSSVNMVTCSISRFTDDFIPDNTVVFDKFFVMSYEEFLNMQMSGKMEISVCNKLFHRSVFEQVRFVPGRRYEDVLFAADLLVSNLGNVVYIDAPLYHYRQQPNSFMNHQVLTNACNSDRVFAGNYLIKRAREVDYEYMKECLFYAVNYPWSFVDPIYVHFQFWKNKNFLSALQKMLRENYDAYKSLILLEKIKRKRMLLFSRSRLLYAFNAYARLVRVYLFHILKRDAYADGHGI